MNTPTPTSMRPSFRTRLFVVLFGVVAPLLELFVLIQVSGRIGFGTTFLLLLAGVVAGVLVLSSQGRKAFASVRDSVGRGRSPHREITDGALLIVAGILLILPGFLGDVVALALLLPPVRALLRGLLAGVVAKRVSVTGVSSQFTSGQFTSGQYSAGNADHPGPQVVRGEVVEDD